MARSAAQRARLLLALLPRLRRGTTVRISDLAATLGVSEDDVARLLNDLVFCGVPPFSPDALIDLEIRADAVTVVSEPPALDRPLRLTQAELGALLAALETAGLGPDDTTFKKLADAAASSDAAERLAQTLRARPDVGCAEIYATLADAIETARKVRLTYQPVGRDAAVDRVVRPYALVNRVGVWYLTAYCELACADRTFRLDRIRGVEPLGDSFSPPAEPATGVVPDLDRLPIATLRVAPGYSVENRDWPGAVVEPQPDGSLLVSIPYASTHWVAREVCAALGAIEALGPEEVRAAVRSYAERLLTEPTA